MTFRQIFLFVLFLAACVIAQAQGFSCPSGQADVMKYFAMSKDRRTSHFLEGKPNSIYTQVFPDQDFAAEGYWLWLKSPKAHGFDVKAFDQRYVYMRATELEWKDNRTFKRFVHDLPIAARCVPEDKAGPRIKVDDTRFEYYHDCRPFKSSKIGKAIMDLDAPEEVDAGGSLGRVSTRVLHYHYDCDRDFDHCRQEEQFFLADGYGLWQWKHFKQDELVKTTLMNDVKKGKAEESLGCPESYQK
ncbi:MAG TPA: hypothetical protein VMT53_11530 [Terriglobales bacterium]|nr:hypothetical protein [Terriglobales bacterium]